MRIQNKHEYKNYLGNRRIAYIQKGNHRLHTLIQFVNNDLVDKLVIESNKEVSHIRDPYKTDTIQSTLLNYNARATEKELRRLLKKSFIPRTFEREVDANKVLSKVSNDLSRIEAERIAKNIRFVENALENADVNIRKYEALVEKLPRQVSRREVLNKCITEETELPPTKRQRWLEKNLERGASYNKKYTYKELNQLSRDLERYKTHRLDFETAMMENRQADREGYGMINETKSWIWSQLEKTRHQGMDGETIPITEKFEVINEVTGDVDYLLFPGDVSNDHNNCSNICNCGCTYDINKS